LPNPIVDSFQAKLMEEIERTQHLIGLLREDDIAWKPQLEQRAMDVAHLLSHLLECLAGFCAVLYKVFPEPLAHFEELKKLPVNHGCGTEEALTRIARYSSCIREGFAQCDDDDLKRMIPTVFVPAGETVMTLLLGNFEHFVNHKYQLFLYLKFMGHPVTTRDLYHFRG